MFDIITKCAGVRLKDVAGLSPLNKDGVGKLMGVMNGNIPNVLF